MAKIRIGEQLFDSFRAACKHYAVDDSYLYKREKRLGIPKEKLLEEKLRKGIRKHGFEYNGVSYSNFASFCREHSLDPRIVQALVDNRNISQIEAANLSLQYGNHVPRVRKGIVVVVDDIEYPSKNAACRAYKVSFHAVRLLMKEEEIAFEEALLKKATASK